MSKRRGAWSLGVDVAVRPVKALDRVLEDRKPALRASAVILAVYMAVSAVFYTLKPGDFPPMEGLGPLDASNGLWFWVGVQVWTPALAAVLIATTAWFAEVMRGGKLQFRLLAAVLSSAIPWLLFVVYARTAAPKWVFGLVWLGLAALTVPGFRRLPKEAWMPLSALLLAVNSLALAMTPLFAATVVARFAAGYNALEIVLLIWTLGVCTYGVARILAMPVPRAFVAVFLGLLMQITFVMWMHLVGVIPNSVLKALMAV
ncbi:MAG: hypothetical protein KGL53_12735 [Elusimicrobia bacterium]|nr:hypothetical protein [Elusimicrobiota bacterium]